MACQEFVPPSLYFMVFAHVHALHSMHGQELDGGNSLCGPLANNCRYETAPPCCLGVAIVFSSAHVWTLWSSYFQPHVVTMRSSFPVPRELIFGSSYPVLSVPRGINHLSARKTIAVPCYLDSLIISMYKWYPGRE